MARSFKTLIVSTAIAGLALTGCSSGSDVPELSSIEATMWETMAGSDAMSITGGLPASMSDDAAIIEDMLGGNIADVQIYGSLDEAATAIRLSADQAPIMYFFGEDVYIELGTLLTSMDTAFPGISTPAEQEQLEQALAAFEGRYLDVSDGFGAAADTLDMGELLQEMRSAAEAGQPDPVTGFDFGQLQEAGSYQQLSVESDATGWFYSDIGLGENPDATSSATHGTFQYIAVTADDKAPRLAQVRNGEQSLMEFGWDDEVDVPERPSDDEIVTQEDVMTLGQP